MFQHTAHFHLSPKFNPLFILVSLSQQPQCYSNRRRIHRPVYTILVYLSQQPRCCSDAKGYDRLPQMHEFLLPPLRSCSLLFVASKINTLKHPKLLTQITQPSQEKYSPFSRSSIIKNASSLSPPLFLYIIKCIVIFFVIRFKLPHVASRWIISCTHAQCITRFR